ncbi:MAG: hypothetical protein HQL13_05015, partial [Candidatus Omnitrophica bacterium]|nr:hypothetical protein [Candidatus Omnitrophota bacterium]
MRINIIQFFIFLFLGLILFALFYMQMIQGGYYHHQSMNNRIRVVPTDALRGRVLDANGLVLADNRPSLNIALIPQDVEDKRGLFDYLAQELDRPLEAIERQFNFKKTASFAPVVLAQDIPRELAVKIEEEKFVYPGLIIQQGFERYYPFDEVGAHVIGYVGKVDEEEMFNSQEYGYTPLSFTGKTGVEKWYDALLQGEPGGRQIEVDSRGHQVRLLGVKESSVGRDVVLTIDQRIQIVAQDLLKGQRGGIVVMDISNGDVLSLVSSPSYDLNAFLDKRKSNKLNAYFKDSTTPLLNRVVTGLYPPGSVFKIPVALAALQLNKITPETTFECSGYMMLGNRKFGCSHVHGAQDLKQALAHSCNVYFFHTGSLLKPSVIGAFAKAFGLGMKTGVDLPFEKRGSLVTGASRTGAWYTGDILNLSIGQGYTLVTPLQLTVLMAAVAN